MEWAVYFTEEAEEMLFRIEDRRIRKLIKSRALSLSKSPDMQGKPLGGTLAGLRSVRAVGQRYRIIYEIFAENSEVWVVTLYGFGFEMIHKAARRGRRRRTLIVRRGDDDEANKVSA